MRLRLKLSCWFIWYMCMGVIVFNYDKCREGDILSTLELSTYFSKGRVWQKWAYMNWSLAFSFIPCTLRKSFLYYLFMHFRHLFISWSKLNSSFYPRCLCKFYSRPNLSHDYSGGDSSYPKRLDWLHFCSQNLISIKFSRNRPVHFSSCKNNLPIKELK
jgi:hypothetical protein